MDAKIVKYYQICAISAPRIHPVANLDTSVMTEYENEMYFMTSKGVLVPKETVIGGWNTADGNVNRREKIVVF